MPDAPTVNTPPATLSKNLSFHLLWSSTMASGIGDRLAMLTALSLLGYAQVNVDNSSMQSGIDFFFFLPYLIWSPIAGWLADRLPRKWLMFAADEIRGIVVLSALIIVPAAGTVITAADIHSTWFTLGPITVTHAWKIWTLLLLIGTMAATFVPAKLSIVPNVVGYKNLLRANAVVVLMGIIGNLLGFFVFKMIGESSLKTTVFIASSCYCVSGSFWVFLKTPWQSTVKYSAIRFTQVFIEIRDGLKYALTHKPIIVMIFATALAWAGTAIYMPALSVVNVDVYRGSTDDLAVVMGCLGLGMLIGAILIGFLNTRYGSELLITAGMIGCAFFIALQMILPGYSLGLVIALFIGINASLLLVPLNTLLQRLTPDHIRGRVFAAREILVEAGKVLIAGLIWQAPGTDRFMQPTAVTLSAIMIIIAILSSFRYVFKGPHPKPIENFLWRIVRLYTTSCHRLQIIGKSYLPYQGPVLIVSNHTAGIDPMLIQSGALHHIRFLMATEYRNWQLNWFWRIAKPILVRRDGNDRSAIRAAVAALKQGLPVAIFPEGGLPTQPTSQIRAFHDGVTLIAKYTNTPIIPAYIHGTPHTDSTFGSYFRLSKSHLVFGKPFTYSDLINELDATNTTHSRNELTQLIRQRVDQLRPVT